MIMRLLAGLWVCAVALGASYGATFWKLKQEQSAGVINEAPKSIELRKIKGLNVPIIAGGAIRGYVVVQIAYTADAEALKKLELPPDVFITDEAFRLIYSDERLDFRDLKKFDLVAFRENIKREVATRLKADVIQDILVPEFSFIPSEDIRK